MAVTAIDVQVDDVLAAVRLLREAYGWDLRGPGNLLVDLCRTLPG